MQRGFYGYSTLIQLLFNGSSLSLHGGADGALRGTDVGVKGHGLGHIIRREQLLQRRKLHGSNRPPRQGQGLGGRHQQRSRNWDIYIYMSWDIWTWTMKELWDDKDLNIYKDSGYDVISWCYIWYHMEDTTLLMPKGIQPYLLGQSFVYRVFREVKWSSVAI